MSQDRKVFVGGVPQDLTQDELYTIFCEYAGVKKAWLQKCRPVDHSSGNGSAFPPQNHRGFGFVIFHEARAIDDLLGSGASRFILLRNGAKLEVKRALSSNKMGSPQADVPGAAPPLQRSYPPTGQDVPQQAAGKQAARGQARNAFRDLPGAPAALAAWPGLGGLAASDSVLKQLALGQPPPPPGYPGGPQGLQAALGGLQHAAAGRPPPPSQPPPPGSAVEGRAQLDGLPNGYAAGIALPPWPPVPPPLGSLDVGDRNGVPQGSLAGLMLSGAGLVPQSQHGGQDPLRAQAGGGTPPEGAGQTSVSALRHALVQFYHEHQPEKLVDRERIDYICQAFKGREAELSEHLRIKYGSGLQLPNGLGLLLPPKGGAGGGAGWQHTGSCFGPPGVLAHHPQTSVAGGCNATTAGAPAACLLTGKAWALQGQAAPAIGRQAKDLAAVLGAWTDAASMGSACGVGAAGAHRTMPDGSMYGGIIEGHNESTPGHEGPDLSWIEGIVGDDGMEMSEDIGYRVASEPRHRDHMWLPRDGQQVW